MASMLRRASNAIPSHIKPPVLVILNIALSSLLSYLATPWIGADIGAVSKPMNELSDYLGLVGWRVVEVLGYWWGGWDANQAAALSTLSLAPSLHFYHTYHPSHARLIPTLAVSTTLAITSIYLPLRFLRPPPPSTTARKSKFSDPTRVLTALLSSWVYQLVLYTSSKKFLTTWLISCGWELESVVRVHETPEAVLLGRAMMMFPVGWAASEIIFFSPNSSEDSAVPSAPAPKSIIKTDDNNDDARTGLLPAIGKLWRRALPPRARKIVRRSLLVAGYQSAAATVGLAGTVRGGDGRGAAGVSGVWTVATVIVGLVLGWVGKV